MTVAPLTEQLSCAMHCARRFTSISPDHQVKSSSSEHYKEGILIVTAEEAGAKRGQRLQRLLLSHTAGKWPSRDSNPGQSHTKACALSPQGKFSRDLGFPLDKGGDLFPRSLTRSYLAILLYLVILSPESPPYLLVSQLLLSSFPVYGAWPGL